MLEDLLIKIKLYRNYIPNKPMLKAINECQSNHIIKMTNKLLNDKVKKKILYFF
jgi:hypothetical protein